MVQAFSFCRPFSSNVISSLLLRPSITALKPQLWLWTGDAIYARGNKQKRNLFYGNISNLPTHNLQIAYRQQLKVKNYQRFLNTGVLVEGVYDDHDYGSNDAGKELPSKRESQKEFLKFIRGRTNTAPDGAGNTGSSGRDRRSGVYSSHLYGLAPQQVKVLLLDTRYHRDSHWIPSLGAWQDPIFGQKVPMGALIAAALRMCTTCTSRQKQTLI